MANKKYSVFISSTFKDLQEERKAARDTIIRAGDVPVGMESFPAADEEQFEFIKKLIDECDYYILIVAGKYGSLAPDGISYTEKEYDYAVSKNIPVLRFVHEAPDKLPNDKCEKTDAGKESLKKFKEKIGCKLWDTWNNEDQLALKITHALSNAKETFQSKGWVRGDDNIEPKKSEQLSNTPTVATIEVPEFTDTVKIELYIENNPEKTVTIETTWFNAFIILYNNIEYTLDTNDYPERFVLNKEKACITVGKEFAKKVQRQEAQDYRIKPDSLERIIQYCIKCKLMYSGGIWEDHYSSGDYDYQEPKIWHLKADKMANENKIDKNPLNHFQIMEIT